MLIWVTFRCRAVAEWNTNIITPKANTTNVTVAELVLRFLKDRKGRVSHTQWDNERMATIALVSLYSDRENAEFDINRLRAVFFCRFYEKMWYNTSCGPDKN